MRLLGAALSCAIVCLTGLAAPVRAQEAKAPAAATAALVNLNQATATDLQQLPGIGPSMAARILEYRQKNGTFKKIEELMNVQGIGEKNFLKLRPLITVGSASRTADR
ncbi:MAG: helix-hairpin-helix domain-containing protein [Acidobacteria bacterium]|nr:helix-hairpin-helix domain-containing protein [Acidobacteriota bacterium]